MPTSRFVWQGRRIGREVGGTTASPLGFVLQFSFAQFLIFLSPNCATSFRSSLSLRNWRKLEHFASICDDLFDKFPYRKYINIYVYDRTLCPYIYSGAVYRRVHKLDHHEIRLVYMTMMCVYCGKSPKRRISCGTFGSCTGWGDAGRRLIERLGKVYSNMAKGSSRISSGIKYIMKDHFINRFKF